VPLPLIRSYSYRIEFYFLRGLELRPLGSAGNLPASPLGQPGHSSIWRERQRSLRNGVTERQYGHGFTETVTETDTDERTRMNGNVRLQTRHNSKFKSIIMHLDPFFQSCAYKVCCHERCSLYSVNSLPMSGLSHPL